MARLARGLYDAAGVALLKLKMPWHDDNQPLVMSPLKAMPTARGAGSTPSLANFAGRYRPERVAASRQSILGSE